jgi:hypothetical protein
MAHGHYEGKDAGHPEVRALFSRSAVLSSDWYKERLRVKQERDVDLWTRHVRALSAFLARPGHRDEALRLGIEERLELAKRELERVSSERYLESLEGTIGADPIHAETTQAARHRRQQRELETHLTEPGRWQPHASE